MWLEVDGDVTYRFLTATTPIDEEHVELRLLFLVREDPGATEISAASRAAIEATIDEHRPRRPDLGAQGLPGAAAARAR